MVIKLKLAIALRRADELRDTFFVRHGRLYGDRFLSENVKAYELYNDALRLAAGAPNRVPAHDAEWMAYIDSVGWEDVWDYRCFWTENLEEDHGLKMRYVGRSGGWLLFPELKADYVDETLERAREALKLSPEEDTDEIEDANDALMSLLGKLTEARKAADAVKSWTEREAIGDLFECIRENWEDRLTRS